MRIAKFDFDKEYISLKSKITENPDDPICLAISDSAFSIDELDEVWERLEAEFIVSPKNKSGDRIVLIDHNGDLRGSALRLLCITYKESGEECEYPL